MAVAPQTLPDLQTLDTASLQALVLAQHAALASRDTEIESLKLLILKLKRMQFGRRSEKLDREIPQLELRLEDLEVQEAAGASDPDSGPDPSLPFRGPRRRPARRPLPETLPRETVIYAPPHDSCPACGGTLRPLGEDVAETLEYVPARFQVIRTVRPKLSCAGCSRIVQEPASSRPIDRGLAGPGLLAHVLVAKYADHLPLYRQADIYAREGLDLDRSTLAGWVGGASRLLAPLVDALRRYVLAAGKLHGDDTPVPVLAPGHGQTRIGRLWTYVRDDRPAGSSDAPAVWFAYSPDRKGEHPQAHLACFRGTLQADGYAGFQKLYEQSGRVIEAACWAHVRRKFHDLYQAHRSPIAAEALQRIGALYGIEQEIRGRSPDDRQQVRHHRTGTLGTVTISRSRSPECRRDFPKLGHSEPSRSPDLRSSVGENSLNWDARNRHDLPVTISPISRSRSPAISGSISIFAISDRAFPDFRHSQPFHRSSNTWGCRLHEGYGSLCYAPTAHTKCNEIHRKHRSNYSVVSIMAAQISSGAFSWIKCFAPGRSRTSCLGK